LYLGAYILDINIETLDFVRTIKLPPYSEPSRQLPPTHHSYSPTTGYQISPTSSLIYKISPATPRRPPNPIAAAAMVGAGAALVVCCALPPPVPEVAEAALDGAPEEPEVPDTVVVGTTEEALEIVDAIDETTEEATEAADVPEAEAGGAVEAAEGL
jgi:hypothetical protein